MEFPLSVRLALHLPLAVALLVTGSLRHWWPRSIRSRDAALAVALTAVAAFGLLCRT